MKKFEVSIVENDNKTFTIKTKSINNKNATKSEIAYSNLIMGYVNETIKNILNEEEKDKNE